MSLTNKNRTIRKYDAKKSLVVKKAANEFEVSEAYVRMCINNDPKTQNRDDIRKFFKKEYEKLESILN